MDKPNFRDYLFDNPSGDWVQSYSDEHFRQRYLGRDGPISCETVMTVRGTTGAEAAIALIRGAWDWWGHGRVAGFTTNADGSSDQILSPVWWFITRIGLHGLPPVDLPDLKGRRVPVLLKKHFTGWSSVDVYPDEGGGAMIIRGRYHGVDNHIPGVSNKMAEGLHLKAEAGRMAFPFPKGTGWVGLLHKLETSHQSEKTGRR